MSAFYYHCNENLEIIPLAWILLIHQLGWSRSANSIPRHKLQGWELECRLQKWVLDALCYCLMSVELLAWGGNCCTLCKGQKLYVRFGIGKNMGFFYFYFQAFLPIWQKIHQLNINADMQRSQLYKNYYLWLNPNKSKKLFNLELAHHECESCHLSTKAVAIPFLN